MAEVRPLRLRYAARAIAQIDAIHSYIAEHNPVAANVVVARIRAAAERLREHPRIGHAGAVAGTLEWVVRGLPYIIVYDLESNTDEVMIVNVFHGSQDRSASEARR